MKLKLKSNIAAVNPISKIDFQSTKEMSMFFVVVVFVVVLVIVVVDPQP